MNARNTVGFPLDRSLIDVPPSSQPVTITGRPLAQKFSTDGDIGALAFAALFVFSRMHGQASLQVPVAIGNGSTSSLFAAEIAPDAKLAQAFSTLRRGGSPNALPEIDLLIVDRTKAGSGGRTTLCLQQGAEPALSLRFDPGQIARVSAEDFLEKIALVLETLGTLPEIRCSDLILVGEAAKKLIPDFSREIPVQSYEFVPTTFFRIAAQHADAPAIAGDAQSYSYRELSCAVRLLAAELIKSGLRNGDVVAIAGLSSFGMLASMLAVLTAGGTLVILDRGLPEIRQQLINDISKPRLRIEVCKSADVKSDAANTIYTADWPAKADLTGHSNAAAPTLDLAPDASAYVFFTSGSTGVPKGVLGTHQGLAHFLDWQRSRFPIGPGDRTAQLTALSFDVVLRDILFPLTSGACIHIPRRDLLLDAPRMLQWIEKTNINAMHCVPSLMKAWLHAHTTGKPFRSLRYNFFAGEPLTDNLLRRFFELAGPETRAVNLYGPTETTLAKLACPIERVEPGVQPIGKPQPGVDVVVFRDRRSPCGLWEIGEIAIRTPYRSKGYFGNEDLTRQAFIQNPWRDTPGDLVYFTGDLGRYRSDGKLEIFGRIDSQIKIRGVRIEPAEIESEMLKDPRIADAAATTRVGADDEKVLLALVVSKAPLAARDQLEFGRAVREDLKGKLHAAMTPARIFVVDKIPYLPNGKLDRKSINALALDAGEQQAAGKQKTAGLSEKMQVLVGGIEEALNGPIDDFGKSFIDLGGDSLSYVKVSILIEELLGSLPEAWAEKPLSEFFKLLENPAPAQTPSPWIKFDVTLLFRAIAIVLIVTSHIKELSFITATSTLFVISGMNFAKFQRPALWQTGDIRPTLKLILKFGSPAGLWQVLRSFALRAFWLPDLFLLGTFFKNSANPHYTLWFLDILAANLLLLGLIWAVGNFIRQRKLAAGDTATNMFRADLFWLSIGLGLAFVQVSTGWGDGKDGETGVAPFKWFWLLALGMLITQADTPKKKAGVSLLLCGLAAAAYSGIPEIAAPFPDFDAFFFASVLLMIWVERLPLPRLLQKPLTVIAASTLFIYIVNYSVINHVMPKLGLGDWWTLSVVTAIAVGIVATVIWNKVVTKVCSLRRMPADASLPV